MVNVKRAYLVVPKLVKQPTWGGTYITEYKGWKDKPFYKDLIGQSYELFSGSFLSLFNNSTDSSFEPLFDYAPENAIPLDFLVSSDPVGVLGTAVNEKYNGALNTLIKFTQAKGNSFQIHIKPGTKHDKWKPKPESWYYFEDGLVTLGISDRRRLREYKSVCLDIDIYMQSLSDEVKMGKTAVEDARKQAKAYIASSKIYEFVNTVAIPKHSVIDLFCGGTHHSWEEDEKDLPLGNIVYEVQLDVMDDVSTLRSFDKGKIKDDGSIRPLQIDDYFKFIDINEKSNEPKLFINKPKEIDKKENYKLEQLFNNQYYKLHNVSFSDTLNNHITDTKKRSFHHLFVSNGSLLYKDSCVDITISKGHSLFVPACIGNYTLTSLDKNATVLKTFI